MIYIELRVPADTINTEYYDLPVPRQKREMRARYGHPCTVAGFGVDDDGVRYQTVWFHFRNRAKAMLFQLRYGGEVIE